jgi:hypothetical protein
MITASACASQFVHEISNKPAQSHIPLARHEVFISCCALPSLLWSQQTPSESTFFLSLTAKVSPAFHTTRHPCPCSKLTLSSLFLCFKYRSHPIPTHLIPPSQFLCRYEQPFLHLIPSLSYTTRQVTQQSFKIGNLNQCHKTSFRFASFGTSEVVQSFFHRGLQLFVHDSDECKDSEVVSRNDFADLTNNSKCHVSVPA